MAFQSGIMGDHQLPGAGEQIGTQHIILSEEYFVDGLLSGRFAKLESDNISNLDGSSDPVIAGVVLRNITAPLDSEYPMSKPFCSMINIVRTGLVTVLVKEGQTPSKFSPVFASNAGNADDGKAITSGGALTGAEFIEEYSPNVWLIHQK